MPELLMFCSGLLIMVLEMVGARVLAPHVGTSTVVWTSLIGVVLACLALGGYVGGRLADRWLSRRVLGHVLTLAGVSCAVTASCHQLIGSRTMAIDNLYLAALAAAVGVFALPGLCCGMLGPYIIRLRLARLETAGATVGRLYALSPAPVGGNAAARGAFSALSAAHGGRCGAGGQGAVAAAGKLLQQHPPVGYT